MLSSPEASSCSSSILSSSHSILSSVCSSSKAGISVSVSTMETSTSVSRAGTSAFVSASSLGRVKSCSSVNFSRSSFSFRYSFFWRKNSGSSSFSSAFPTDFLISFTEYGVKLKSSSKPQLGQNICFSSTSAPQNLHFILLPLPNTSLKSSFRFHIPRGRHRKHCRLPALSTSP